MSTAKRVLMITGLLLVVGFIIQCLYDPLAPYRNQRQLNKLQNKLNQSRQKWNSQNIRDYSFEVQYGIPMWGLCGAKITVWQGRITGVIEKIHGGLDKFPEPVVLDPEDWDHDYCHYSDLTIPEIFSDVQEKINERGTVEASFDPEFGFVTEYHGNLNISRALLRVHISDSEFGFSCSNFQKLASSVP